MSLASADGTFCRMKSFEAAYENGVLRPAKPLPLMEGEHVRVVVVRRPDPTRWNLDRIVAGAGEDVGLTEAGLDDWGSALDAEDAR